jgi:hypothetical protein
MLHERAATVVSALPRGGVPVSAAGDLNDAIAAENEALAGVTNPVQEMIDEARTVLRDRLNARLGDPNAEDGASVGAGSDALATDEAASDLPLNFHPAGTGALWVDTPNGAGGATDRCAEFSGNAARLSVAVNRSSANAWGVW